MVSDAFYYGVEWLRCQKYIYFVHYQNYCSSIKQYYVVIFKGEQVVKKYILKHFLGGNVSWQYSNLIK